MADLIYGEVEEEGLHYYNDVVLVYGSFVHLALARFVERSVADNRSPSYVWKSMYHQLSEMLAIKVAVELMY